MVTEIVPIPTPTAIGKRCNGLHDVPMLLTVFTYIIVNLTLFFIYPFSHLISTHPFSTSHATADLTEQSKAVVIPFSSLYTNTY